MLSLARSPVETGSLETQSTQRKASMNLYARRAGHFAQSSSPDWAKHQWFPLRLERIPWYTGRVGGEAMICLRLCYEL
jgi:hypothetical protein